MELIQGQRGIQDFIYVGRGDLRLFQEYQGDRVDRVDLLARRDLDHPVRLAYLGNLEDRMDRGYLKAKMRVIYKSA